MLAGRGRALLRRQGYDAPVPLHGALLAMVELYRSVGVELGPVEHATDAKREDLKGRIVLAPPGATSDLWARRLPDPIVAMASGWMRVKQRAKARSVELPLVISDHSDWDELVQTFTDVGAPEVWVTHGNEEALVRQATLMGTRTRTRTRARALSLIGFDEEEG